MIYLDNSATTRTKPKEVISEVVRALTTLSANPGRSGHIASLNAALEVGETRELLCNIFGAESPENVIFTQNCTDSLNLAILGTVKKGGHVITTAFEHNSTLRPLTFLKEQGLIELTIVQPKETNKITLLDILPHVKPNTYLISTVQISNVDGAETDIFEIGNFCKENNILYLVDGAQSAGHKRINMQKQNISMLALAGHKGLYGPQGIGVLLLNKCPQLKPIKFGGTGTESYNLIQPTEKPEAFESGTIALPNILGLKAGLKFVENNFNKIEEKIKNLTKMLINELKNIKNLKIYTNENNLNGVVSFNISNIDSTIVSEFLNEKYQICVRSGLHCAPLKHKHLGTVEQGTIRASISYFSNQNEISMLIQGIEDFIRTYDVWFIIHYFVYLFILFPAPKLTRALEEKEYLFSNLSFIFFLEKSISLFINLVKVKPWSLNR